MAAKPRYFLQYEGRRAPGPPPPAPISGRALGILKGELGPSICAHAIMGKRPVVVISPVCRSPPLLPSSRFSHFRVAPCGRVFRPPHADRVAGDLHDFQRYLSPQRFGVPAEIEPFRPRRPGLGRGAWTSASHGWGYLFGFEWAAMAAAYFCVGVFQARCLQLCFPDYFDPYGDMEWRRPSGTAGRKRTGGESRWQGNAGGRRRPPHFNSRHRSDGIGQDRGCAHAGPVPALPSLQP